MSDTPRTDAALIVGVNFEYVDADFARQMERDLAAAQSQLAAARLDSQRLDALQRYCDRCTTAGMRAIFQVSHVDDGEPNDIRVAIDALPKTQVQP